MSMRISQGSFALIARQSSGRTELLTQWNERWRAFSLIGGHKTDGESFRTCLSREVSEELGLTEGKEFKASNEPILHAEYTAWSASAKSVTAYTHEVFQVELVGAKTAAIVNTTPQNRWLTEDEILAGMTHDGWPVSPTVKRIVAQLSTES
jgi:isopentenyldiphosphate isomerase